MTDGHNTENRPNFDAAIPEDADAQLFETAFGYSGAAGGPTRTRIRELLRSWAPAARADLRPAGSEEDR